MLDPIFRPIIHKPLDAVGRWLAGIGLSANQVTFAGLGLGLAAAIAIALGGFAIGLFLFLLSRIGDGLDGAVARVTTPTDQGGFLDIALDFFVYAAIPLAFAVYDPSSNAARRSFSLVSSLMGVCFWRLPFWRRSAPLFPTSVIRDPSIISEESQRGPRPLRSLRPFVYSPRPFPSWRSSSA